MNYAQFLAQVLSQTSEIARENFGKVKGTTKTGDNNQVLTATDLEIGKFVIAQIDKEFSEHNIIDEEAGIIDRQSQFTWVVDPIDGTSNFANGVPTYGTIIGLLENDVPIAGGISLPEFGKIITAEKGKGAFDGKNKLQVTSETELKNVLVAYGIDSKTDKNKTIEEGKLIVELVSRIRNLRTSNSVFDSVMVAQGSYGALLSRSTKIWDNVGQQVIIEEVGGIYNDYFGNKIDYSNPMEKANDNFTICFGAPTVYRQIQEIIKEFS